MHHSKEKIVDTIELYVGCSVSTRYAAQYLEISKNTILRWVFEYVGMISRFTKRLVPRIIQEINLDEFFLKMCSQFFYLWDAICADSGFVFFFFAPTRKNKDAEKLIKQFRNAMLMVFDGAFQYPSVLKKIFGIW